MSEELGKPNQQSLVIVASRRDRGIILQNLLRSSGYKVLVTISLYDALQAISQEMPHLIVSEAILSDGHAGNLFDRLAQHPALKRIPILVNILRKTKEEISAVANRKFAGFLVGSPQASSLLAKIAEINKSQASFSPYFIDLESNPIDKKVMVSVESTIIGRADQQIVARSNVELDSLANLLCVPSDNRYFPAVFRMASNLKKGSQIYNLFPANRVMGKGQLWIEELPEINMSLSAVQKERDPRRRVIFFDPNEERYQQFSEILLGYDIELIYAESLSRVLSLLKQRAGEISSVYLYELTQSASGIEWKKTFTALPANAKPPLIIGTSSLKARSTPGMQYLKRPFGLGVFVDTLRASFENAEEISQGIEQSGYRGISASYQAPAKLIGLDELGGILEIRFPLTSGSRLLLHHEFLKKTWDHQSQVSIIDVRKLPDKADTWHARFQVLEAGVSKTKYWTKMSEAVSALAVYAKPAAEKTA